jgi:hypothetical protein
MVGALRNPSRSAFSPVSVTEASTSRRSFTLRLAPNRLPLESGEAAG